MEDRRIIKDVSISFLGKRFIYQIFEELCSTSRSELPTGEGERFVEGT